MIIPKKMLMEYKNMQFLDGLNCWACSKPLEYLLIRVSTNSPVKLDNLATSGDRTFSIWKG